MGASRTRQTRAVSYKQDSSSDESDNDVRFTVQRSARNDSVYGSNSGELGASNNIKGRRTLALRKNRIQDRGDAREEQRVHREQEKNGWRQPQDSSPNRLPSTTAGEFEPAYPNFSPETRTVAFQHLVDVAFDVTNVKKHVTDEDTDLVVEAGRQMESSASGEESPNQPRELENGNTLHADDERELKLVAESALVNMEEGSRDILVSPINAVRQCSKAGSDEDDWLQDDVVNGDSSDSASSDFSSEDASDSDIDVERPAKKRQSTKSVAKKPQQSSSRSVINKGLRTKSGAATEGKVSSNRGQKADSKRTPAKPVGRSRKIVSPTGNSTTVRSSVGGTGATLCTGLPPVKLRLKMASKEANSNASPCGPPSGSVAVQLISSNNLPHRRVVGLSRRCRPPPLHPYLAGM